MEAPLEPPAKKKKGSKGYPPGIFDHNSGDKQARLIGVKVDGKAYQRPIPGRYKSIEAAVAAQAVAAASVVATPKHAAQVEPPRLASNVARMATDLGNKTAQQPKLQEHSTY